jgi:hypothetical protein
MPGVLPVSSGDSLGRAALADCNKIENIIYIEVSGSPVCPLTSPLGERIRESIGAKHKKRHHEKEPCALANHLRFEVFTSLSQVSLLRL